MLLCLAFPWLWATELWPKAAAEEEGAVGVVAEAAVRASSPQREEGARAAARPAAILALAVARARGAILAPAVARAGGAVVWLTFGSAAAAGGPVAVRGAGSSGKNGANIVTGGLLSSVTPALAQVG